MANLKFYFTPGSCSTGIHILLEELELIFEAYVVDLLKGDQNTPEYLAMNPKGTIPTLVLKDGTALTDFVAIAWWLAQQHPSKALLPTQGEAQIQLLDLMNYIINTIHGQGYTRVFTTDKYSALESEHAKIREQGIEIVKKGLALINSKLEDGYFSFGDFTILDAALFYVEFWTDRIHLQLPPSCMLHYQRMLQRPAVRQVLMEEGYHSTLTMYTNPLQANTSANNGKTIQ